MNSAAEPAVAPPKTKPGTKPGTRPTPSTPKHPKPAVSPKPKAKSNKSDWRSKHPFVDEPIKSTAIKSLENKTPKSERVMSRKVKLNKKYPKKFVKEHISSYFCVDIIKESIDNDYSVELQLVGKESELVKCLKNLKEGNVIN
jgi:hypothetical protein